MGGVPRVKSASPISPTQLLVSFEDGSQRVYDCAPLLDRPEFQLLRTPAFFRAVRVDPGGYGISWNDDIDLSEYELWTNGRPAGDEPHPPTTARQRTALAGGTSPPSSSKRGVL